MKQSKLTGAIALMGSQAIVLFLGYIIHPWVGRLLGPSQYGLYGIILSIQTIFGIILTLGVPSAVSKFVAQNNDGAKSILRQGLKIQALFGISIAVILSALAPVIAWLLGDDSLIKYLMFSSGIILIQAFYPVYSQFLSGMHHFNKQAALTATYAIAKLIGAISLIYVFSLYGALSGFAVGGVIAALLGWYWTYRMGGAQEYHIELKKFISFAGTYAIILVGLQMLMSIDLFMVKAILHNDAQAGYYNAAVSLSRISYMLLQGLAFVLLPSVAALTKPGQSHDKAAAFIKDALRYLIALIVPSVALASATSKELIILFFAKEYVSAAPVLTILMVGLGALSFYLLLTNIVAGAGKAHVSLYITIAMLIISAGLGMFLIPQYGLIGAAWQTTITSLLGLTALGIYTFQTFKIPYPIKSIVHIIIATIVMVLPTYFWKASSFVLPIQYIILFGIYIGILWMLGEVKKEDRALLASLKKPKENV